MCTAPWIDGLPINPGDDVEVVRELVDLHRAEEVDTEITPMLPAPPLDAPRWTIDFRHHGGFVATTSPTGDGAMPWRI